MDEVRIIVLNAKNKNKCLNKHEQIFLIKIYQKNENYKNKKIENLNFSIFLFYVSMTQKCQKPLFLKVLGHIFKNNKKMQKNQKNQKCLN